MSNYLIALAIAGAISVPASAQPAPSGPAAPAANQAQPPKPQMVKKTVCEDNDNPYSHIARTCHTVMVPARSAQPNQQAQTPQQADLGN